MASSHVVLSFVHFLCVLVMVEGQVISFPILNAKTGPSGSCRTSTGEAGRCVQSSTCIAEIKPGSFHQICAFNPIRFCCPEKGVLIENKNVSISNLKQVSPPDISLDCGIKGSIPIIFGGPSHFESVPALSRTFPKFSAQRQKKRASVPFLSNDKFVVPDNVVHVVGGIRSFAHSWPWMVLLGTRRGPSVKFFCGGSLINNRYVLTAAHCVLDPAPFFVRVGEHGIQEAAAISKREDVEMEKVIFHPNYQLGQGYYDIALIKLAKSVKFRKEVKPVCLPWGQTGTQDLVGQTVTVTGWGAEVFGGDNSPTLREVRVEVFEPSKCQQSYATLPDFVRSFPKGMSKDNIVCAGDLEGGKDSCQGDSGGPMVHGLNGRFILAGIISKGYGCGKVGYPGLYAPLRHYDTLQWIKTTAF